MLMMMMMMMMMGNIISTLNSNRHSSYLYQHTYNLEAPCHANLLCRPQADRNLNQSCGLIINADSLTDIIHLGMKYALEKVCTIPT